MKLAIIKAIIGWLWRNHKFLLMETVVPEGSHIQRHKLSKEARERIAAQEKAKKEYDAEHNVMGSMEEIG